MRPRAGGAKRGAGPVVEAPSPVRRLPVWRAVQRAFPRWLREDPAVCHRHGRQAHRKDEEGPDVAAEGSGEAHDEVDHAEARRSPRSSRQLRGR